MTMFEQLYETHIMTESHERAERRRQRRRRAKLRARKERQRRQQRKEKKAPREVVTPVPLTGFAAILMAPKVTNAVLRAFMTRGWRRRQDLEDLLGEVRLAAVKAFNRRGVRPPETVDQMCCFCVKIARNHAASIRRRERVARENGYVGLCELPDEELPLEDRWEGRDPIDAHRQLEVAADLFRQGRMPEHGVEILYNEGVGAKWKDIGADVGISDRAVEGRLKTMRMAFGEEIVKRGMG